MNNGNCHMYLMPEDKKKQASQETCSAKVICLEAAHLRAFQICNN